MQRESSSSLEPDQHVATSWAWDLGMLTAAVAVVYLCIGTHPPLGSAIRYAASAREMAESHNYIIPTLDYVPYFEKPILTYWLGALCQLLFGSSSLAVALPSALCACTSVGATYCLGRTWRNRSFAVFASLLLLFSGMFLTFTSIYLTDTILAACLAVAWCAFYRHDHHNRAGIAAGVPATTSRWLWTFHVALALGVLTKGPIAIILAGCGVGGYLLLSDGPVMMWRGFWQLRPLSGLLILAAIDLPWNILVWQQDPRFIEFFYVRINFQAFFDKNINHPGPPWYYLGLLAIMVAPWTFIALPALTRALWQVVPPACRSCLRRAHHSGPRATPDASRSQRQIPGDQGQLYLACVVVFPVLFLSVSASKLGTYALPLYPAVALLVADQFWRLQRTMPGWLRCGLLIQAVLSLLAGLVYIGFLARPIDLEQVDWNYLPLLAVAIGIFLISGLWSGIVAWRGKLLRALAINGLALFITIAVLLPNAFHVLKYIDARALTVAILHHGQRADAILVTNDCVQDYSILWQLDRPLSVLGDPRELGMGMYTQATAHDAPWPIDVHTGHPTMDLTELRREQVPGQTRLWTPAQTAQAWSGSRRIWLFGAGPWILPLLAAGKTVYEVGRTDKVTLVTNLPIPGVTSAAMTHYTHGLP